MDHSHIPLEPLEDNKNGSVSQVPEKKVTTIMLAFMAYVAVFGCGPYALESLVSTGYPLLTLIGIATVPWLNGIQCSLMTAELSSAIPHNGGYLIWVKMAFGSYWGFVVAAFALFSSIVDLALYPVLFCDYLDEFISFSWSGSKPVLVFLFILFCLSLGIIGVKSVGTASIVFTVLGLVPFFMLVGWGLPRIEPTSWTKMPPDFKLVNWGLWISLTSWCVQGFDALSCVAEDMKKPSQYPIAMVLALLLIIITAILPIATVVSVDQDYANYTPGYFVTIAEKIGGRFLRYLIIGGALIGTLASFNIYLYTTSTYLSVLGGKEFIGMEWIQRKNRFGAPYLAQCFLAVVIFLLSFLHFGSLIQVDQAFYALSLFLKYGALVKLRKSQPNLPRPYKIGLETKGLIIFITPSLLLCSAILITTLSSSWVIFGIVVGAVITCTLPLVLLNILKKDENVVLPQKEEPHQNNDKDHEVGTPEINPRASSMSFLEEFARFLSNIANRFPFLQFTPKIENHKDDGLLVEEVLPSVSDQVSNAQLKKSL